MCVIIANRGAAMPSREELEAGCMRNPDGFGWAVVWDEGRDRFIQPYWSMNAQEAIDSYFELMDSLDASSILCSAFHARITTHGNSVIGNCHPWKVGDEDGTYLFHNGVISGCNPGKDDPRSDTGVFAEDLLPAIGGLEGLQNPLVLNMVEDYIGYSRLVILTNNDAYAPMTIVNEDMGDWSGDSWFSNSSCWAPRTKTTTTYSGSGYVSPYGASGYKSNYVSAWDSDDDVVEAEVVKEVEEFISADGWKFARYETKDNGEVFIRCGIDEQGSDISSTHCYYCGLCFTCGEWDCICNAVTQRFAAAAHPEQDELEEERAQLQAMIDGVESFGDLQ